MNEGDNKYAKVDSLLDALVLYTKLFHKPFSAEALLSGLPVHSKDGDIKLFSIDSKSKSLFSRVAARAGLKSILIKRPIANMLRLHLPMILLLSGDNACILEKFSDDKTKAKIIYPVGKASQEWVSVEDLEKEYLGFGFLLKKEFKYDTKDSRALEIKSKHWFWSTIKRSSGIYRDVLWASLLINIFVLALPLYIMNVYDRVIPINAMETLTVLTVGIVFIFILDFFLKTTRTYMLELAGKKSDIIMSSIIFEKILNLKMSAYPRSVGSFANRLKEFESVRSFFANATMVAIIDLPFTIIFLAVIYYISGDIVFVPITIMCLILMYALFIKKSLKTSIEASQEASATKNAILIETLHNIETVKSMGMTGKQQWEWEESTGEISDGILKSSLISASVPKVTGLLTKLNRVLVIVLGVYLIQNFELTTGGLLVAMILSSRAIAPVGKAAGLITNYSRAKSAYESLNNIISKEVERPEGEEFVERPSFNGKIEFKDVTFAYPGSEVPALNNVNFVINSGEKVAIIGRIGSGKSTIAKLILKLYEPTSGSIFIDDIDISQIDPADLRRSIGYVPQEIHLFRGTVKDNIISSDLHPDMEDVIHAAQISGVDDFVRTHPRGYEMQVGERGAELSGGQRQSIGVARALMQDSAIMLMDEPTAFMDQTTESGMLKRFKVEFKKQTLILVTQKLGLLSMVDRVIVMHHSKLLLDGPKEEIVKKLSGS